MNTFKHRIEKGNELLYYLHSYLELNNIAFYNSGYEYTSGSTKNKIAKLNDNTSKFIRFYPDSTIVGERQSCLVESKNSTGIEKDCYESYLALKEKHGVNILLFLKNKMLCNVEGIVFNHAKSYDAIAQMNVPVTENIWREPRAMNKEDYELYIRRYKDAKKYTSGCSFAFIDFHKTKFYNLSILKKL